MLPLYLWILFIIIILQRIIELFIAKRNEQWMKARGGIEKGQSHYKWFILLHTLFFCSLFVEIIIRDVTGFKLPYVLFIIFIITQVVRIWCITALGRCWNTKIIISPDLPLVNKGPYKYVKHPNYIVVGIELFVIPLLFGAYITAMVFPILHMALLTIRIPYEEKALQKMIPK